MRLPILPRRDRAIAGVAFLAGVLASSVWPGDWNAISVLVLLVGTVLLVSPTRH